MNSLRSLSALTVIFFVLICGQVKAQSYESVYNQAIVMIEQNKLDQADALLTSLVDARPNKLVLYNRGLVRQAMGNECGYCNDMRRVYQAYTDELALRNIQKECLLKSDTVYKSKKFVTVPVGSKYRYREVEIQYKCRNAVEGKLIDTEQLYSAVHIPGPDFGWNNILSMTMPKTNTFATFIYQDSSKVYTSFVGINRPTIKRNKSSWGDQLDIIALTLANRYPEIFEQDSYMLATVTIDESGDIFKVSNSLESSIPTDVNDEINHLLRDKILEFLDCPTNTLFKKRVKTRHSWILEF